MIGKVVNQITHNRFFTITASRPRSPPTSAPSVSSKLLPLPIASAPGWLSSAPSEGNKANPPITSFCSFRGDHAPGVTCVCFLPDCHSSSSSASSVFLWVFSSIAFLWVSSSAVSSWYSSSFRGDFGQSAAAPGVCFSLEYYVQSTIAPGVFFY